MKLPDFKTFASLNELKVRMGMPRDYFAGFQPGIKGPSLSSKEQEKLSSGQGIEVNREELKFLNDGTISYKGQRVLLYIRDVAIYQNRDSLPRFHFSNCSTLSSSKELGSFDKRYVVSNQRNGRFTINKTTGSSYKTSEEILSVCQNCLNHVAYGGFTYSMQKTDRRSIVEEFRVEEFFVSYPIDYIRERPPYNYDDAPLNIYPHDFKQISDRCKQNARWCCDCCKKDLSSPEMQPFLHSHHIDRVKGNNASENLRALCILCHSQQPNHGHLRSTPQYLHYMAVTARA